MQSSVKSSRQFIDDTASSRFKADLTTGVMLGIGIAGFVDEAVFHQLLQWHNFYWNTNDHGRILSDGLFHVGSIFIGAGGFNTYDGVVQHVIFHFHLVNEHVCQSPMNGTNSLAICPQDIPYEVVWIALGAAITVAGVIGWRRAATSLKEAGSLA